MSVAALYDVHGNPPALDAPLAEPDVASADRIVVGGDVAAGPRPVETIERPQSLGDRALWIRGNGDRELAEGGEEPLVRRTGETLELRRTPYDLEGTVAAIAASGFGEWPSATKAEVEEYFESFALGG